MQNAGRSYNSGIELVYSHEVVKWFSFNINANAYHNQIDAFSVTNLYPKENLFNADKQEIYSGNIKINGLFKFQKNFTLQVTSIYLAPDLIPQGTIDQRYSLDIGIKKTIQKGKGELFVNATDLLNTMKVKKTIQGSGFNYISTDYYETQVIRFGYTFKF